MSAVLETTTVSSTIYYPSGQKAAGASVTVELVDAYGMPTSAKRNGMVVPTRIVKEADSEGEVSFDLVPNPAGTQYRFGIQLLNTPKTVVLAVVPETDASIRLEEIAVLKPQPEVPEITQALARITALEQINEDGLLLSIGTVETLEPNQPASVSVVPDPDGLGGILSFGIPRGYDGLSAYALAVQEGFPGTIEQWFMSLQGEDGKSAYQSAVSLGYPGTEAQWVASLAGKSAYQSAVDQGFQGTEAQWVAASKNTEYLTSEGTNKWFTEARVLATKLLGLTTVSDSVISAATSIKEAVQILIARIALVKALAQGAVDNAKANAGLLNVDNTSDASKPVSNPQSAAIAQGVTDSKAYADTVSDSAKESARSLGAWVEGVFVKAELGGIRGNPSTTDLLPQQYGPGAVVEKKQFTAFNQFSAAGEMGAALTVKSEDLGVGSSANSAWQLSMRPNGQLYVRAQNGIFNSWIRLGRLAYTTDLPTRTTLGVNNLDNTSDANKPVSVLTQSAIDAARESVRSLGAFDAGVFIPNDLTAVRASTSRNTDIAANAYGQGLTIETRDGTVAYGGTSEASTVLTFSPNPPGSPLAGSSRTMQLIMRCIDGRIYVRQQNTLTAFSGRGYLAFLSDVTKGNVGLGNVDNTSDANKPVSTLQASAIALKEPLRVVTTWAARPALNSVPAGTIIILSDFSFTEWVNVNQTYWRPMAGKMFFSTGVPSNWTGDTILRSLLAVTIPAGMMVPGCILAGFQYEAFTGTAGTKTLGFRLNGTSMRDVTASAGLVSYGYQHESRILNDGTITSPNRFQASSYGSSGSPMYPLNIDVSVANLFELTAKLNNAADTLFFWGGHIELTFP